MEDNRHNLLLVGSPDYEIGTAIALLIRTPIGLGLLYCLGLGIVKLVKWVI